MPPTRSGCSGSRRPCSPPPPTTRSARSTPGPGSRCCRRRSRRAPTTDPRCSTSSPGRCGPGSRPPSRSSSTACPGPNERWYLFQTLIGTWPIEPDRLRTHLEKAFREAKVHTSWVEPNTAWEERVQAFARAVTGLPPFSGDPDGFLERVRREGELASLGQTLLRTTAPGIPDTYQGDEGWFLALVDPDNRRPIDWAPRRAGLDRLLDGDPPTADTVKLHVLHQALQLRRRRPEAFAGAYRPIDAGAHTVAFTRGDDEVAVVVALRPDADARVAAAAGLAGARSCATARSSPTTTPSRSTDLAGPWRLALLERR